MSLREKIEAMPRWGLRADSVLQSMEPWNNGQYLLRADVLRIVAEHEQQSADLIAAIYGFVALCTRYENILLLHPCGKCTCGGEGICGWCEISSLKERIEELEDYTKGCGKPVNLLSAEGESIGVAVTAPPVGQAGGNGTPTCAKCRQPMRHDGGPDYSCDTCGTKHTVRAGEQMARQQVPAEVRLWRKELERLTGFASVASGSERARLAALRDLVILANVIASGRGQALVPEGVAAALGKESAHGVGQWMRYHGGNVELFRLIDGRHATAQEMLVAINTYGDSLCGAP